MSITAMKQALEALTDSIDDVQECLNDNLPHAGYARYDHRIEAYREKIAKHEKAIADLTTTIEEADHIVDANKMVRQKCDCKCPDTAACLKAGVCLKEQK